MKKYFFLAAAAAMMLSACSDNEFDSVNEGPLPLTIGTSFNDLNEPMVATRGNLISLQGDKYETDNSNQMGIFILKENANSTTESYERFNVATTSKTPNSPATKYTLIDVTTSGQQLFYPEEKTQPIDVYAYAPYINATATTASYVPTTFNDISSQVITYFTEKDQTAKADYYASDVLWGCAGTGTNVDNAAATNGPYDKLKGTGTSRAKNYEISAKKHLELKKADSDGDGSADLSASAEVGAYYFTYDGTTTPPAHKADIVVPMLHRGSKIVVKLSTKGMDLTKLQNADVIFNVDYVQGALNISTGGFSTAGTAATGTAGDIYLTKRLGIDNYVGRTLNTTTSKWDLDAVTEEGTEGTGASKKYVCSAVVVPQTLSSRSLIKIVLYNDCQQKTVPTSPAATDYWDNPGTDVPKWSLPTATYAFTGGASLESGKVYTYDIEVQASGLTVTTSVSDWIEASATPTSGSAVLQ